MIVTLLVPLAIRLVFGAQVDHVGEEGTGVKSGGIFLPLTALGLDVGKKNPGGLAQIVKDEREELLLIVLDTILS